MQFSAELCALFGGVYPASSWDKIWQSIFTSFPVDLCNIVALFSTGVVNPQHRLAKVQVFSITVHSVGIIIAISDHFSNIYVCF